MLTTSMTFWFSSFFASCLAFFKREPGIHQWALGRGQRRMSLASTEYKSKVVINRKWRVFFSKKAKQGRGHGGGSGDAMSDCGLHGP
jgi:hypothetical protein